MFTLHCFPQCSSNDLFLTNSELMYNFNQNESTFSNLQFEYSTSNHNLGNSESDEGSTNNNDTEFSGATGTTYLLILVVLLTSLIVLTIVGNALVCLAVILVRKLRKPQNYLLVSLATSDLFVALFVMPFAIINEFHQNKWPLNPALCDLWVSADVLCCTASILNLCGISVDRYHAITSPLEYSAKTSPKRMLAVIFFVWLGSACVSLPPLLLLGNEHYDPDDPSVPICTVSQNFWYQIYATMASFYVPLCVMVVVYVKILKVVADKKKEMSWKLRPAPIPVNHSNHHHSNSLILKANKSIKKGPLQQQQQPNGGIQSIQQGPESGNCINVNPSPKINRCKKDKLLGGLREHKASTTLGIIMSAFIICWLPFFVLALVRPFCTIYHVEIPGWVSSLFLWLGYANSALNPVIYATLNRDFRRPFKEILCFRCSTLDSLMRREFYNHQFGDDPENIRQKQLLASSSKEDEPDGSQQPTSL